MLKEHIIQSDATCGVCGIALRGIAGEPGRSGRLLCESCHAKFGGVRHSTSLRLTFRKEIRSHRPRPTARKLLFGACIAVAIVAAWWFTRG
ncbi:MAG: hypothetical protein KIS92_11675 [Planctomycetota bacterium]|nr:hypothetical protein [Planctomycetota bacterium]